MTGETESGITFGATIRADNAIGGEGDAPLSGQTAGSVFVSGSWGTLTYGDTNAADEQWVGDVPGDYSLTGLAELDETQVRLERRQLRSGLGQQLRRQPVRASDGALRHRHRRVRPVAVVQPRPDRHRRRRRLRGRLRRRQLERRRRLLQLRGVHRRRRPEADSLRGPGIRRPDSCSTALAMRPRSTAASHAASPSETPSVPDGEQWSAGLKGEYENSGFGVTYTKLDTDTDAARRRIRCRQPADRRLVRLRNAWSVGAVYGNILNAEA